MGRSAARAGTALAQREPSDGRLGQAVRPLVQSRHALLGRSEEQRAREKAERAALRRKQWRRLQLTAFGLAALLAYAVWNGIVARRANALAEQNLRDAVRAVDASLALVNRNPSQLGIDHADVIAIRRDLAERARGFYSEFIKRGFGDERLRQSVAAAHSRSSGQANRVLGARDGAAAEYTEAIEQFSRLTHDYPDTPQFVRRWPIHTHISARR